MSRPFKAVLEGGSRPSRRISGASAPSLPGAAARTSTSVSASALEAASGSTPADSPEPLPVLVAPSVSSSWVSVSSSSLSESRFRSCLVPVEPAPSLAWGASELSVSSTVSTSA